MFTDRESREELGLGQIRDALSDGLFPGSSTLHTRARYLFFIPWIFQQVSEQRGTLEQARRQELALITALERNGRGDEGIIGRRAGLALKTVASSLYWSALGTYGILLDHRLSREEAISMHARPRAQREEERIEPRVWRATIPGPDPQTKFPVDVPRGMALTFEEAVWLQERFIDSARNSLLAHLAQYPPQGAETPWQDSTARSVQGPARRLLDHAQRFSDVMHGAQLLYNVLIAESYEAHQLTRHQGKVDEFQGKLSEWSNRVDVHATVADWDLAEFFGELTRIRGNQPIPPLTRSFVEEWVGILKRSNPHDTARNTEARDLVHKRERRNKGPMARIGNPKLLGTWGGSSGAARYIFRWTVVKTILEDLHAGLAVQATELADA